jgi:hypothetical protein
MALLHGSAPRVARPCCQHAAHVGQRGRRGAPEGRAVAAVVQVSPVRVKHKKRRRLSRPQPRRALRSGAAQEGCERRWLRPGRKIRRVGGGHGSQPPGGGWRRGRGWGRRGAEGRGVKVGAESRAGVGRSSSGKAPPAASCQGLPTAGCWACSLMAGGYETWPWRCCGGGGYAYARLLARRRHGGRRRGHREAASSMGHGAQSCAVG